MLCQDINRKVPRQEEPLLFSMFPHTAETKPAGKLFLFYLFTSYTGEHPSLLSLWITFPLCTSNPMHRVGKYTPLMGSSKNKETRALLRANMDRENKMEQS